MNIYQTISKIIEQVPAIGKTKTNEQQKFKYRGIDEIMNAFQPLFAKNKLFIIPEVLEQIREERQSKTGGNLIYSICKIKYTFYAEDGSNVQAIVIGEGMDSGDKATNKAMAIAMKYAMFQVFCIPTEEMKDPDSETHEVKSKKPSKKEKPTPYDFEPMTPEQIIIIAKLDEPLKEQLREFHQKDPLKLTKKEATTAINSLTKKGLIKTDKEIEKEKKDKKEVF